MLPQKREKRKQQQLRIIFITSSRR